MKRRRFIARALAAPAILRWDASYNLPVVPNLVRPQVVSNGGIIPEVLQNVATISLWEMRSQVKNGPFPASDLRLALYTGSINLSGLGEIPTGNAATLQAGIESITQGLYKAAPIAGQILLPEVSGMGMLITDPVGLSLAANEVFRLQLGTQVNAGDFVALSRFNAGAVNLTGWNAYRSVLTLATSQIGTVGTWSGSGRFSGNGGPCVTAVIGTPTQNYPSVAMLGDSNLVGRDDATPDAFGNYGHIAKALYSAGPGGASVPVMNLAQSGERATTITNGLGSARLTLLKYASHVITNYGANDLRGGAEIPSVLQDALTTLWAMLRGRGLRVIEQTIVPFTTSTDNWTTTANQTYGANFQPGGYRDQMNTFKVNALATGLIDGLIDVNTVLADATDPSKWAIGAGATALTADGQHANSAGHTLCVPVALAALNSLKLPLTPIRIPV